jgi:hypothetical protein
MLRLGKKCAQDLVNVSSVWLRVVTSHAMQEFIRECPYTTSFENINNKPTDTMQCMLLLSYIKLLLHEQNMVAM